MILFRFYFLIKTVLEKSRREISLRTKALNWLQHVHTIVPLLYPTLLVHKPFKMKLFVGKMPIQPSC